MPECGHTPGPWEANERPYRLSGSDDGPNFSGGDWEVVAPLGESGPVLIANSYANAKLAAAAPELLRALKQAREEFDECRVDTAGTPSEQYFAELLAEVDAAIALAEPSIEKAPSARTLPSNAHELNLQHMSGAHLASVSESSSEYAHVSSGPATVADSGPLPAKPCQYCVEGTNGTTDWTGAIHDEPCSERGGTGIAAPSAERAEGTSK